MSYLLIGNISALICDDCIEPLANARIRIYLPDDRQKNENVFNDLRPLSAREVLMKADRLLAQTTLDEHGNFSLSWEESHLFTEPLDLDLCLDNMPGKKGKQQPRNYHLSRMVLPWKRSRNGYLSAYAYVVPSETWNVLCGNAGVWVITGLVKPQGAVNTPSQLKVEAFNAATGHKIGQAFTNENGRYMMRFSGMDLYGSAERYAEIGPDVYFKIYRDNYIIWEENEQHAAANDRRNLAPCSCHHIIYKSSIVKRASEHLYYWLNGIAVVSGIRRRKQEVYSLRYRHHIAGKEQQQA
ncbi:MAG TPA: hypothetical protein VM802_00655 [Chitinophaga sp.]|uniref:hypothetical protein n=1 Tax=Chitinophaga sp. TaxID=1869181 RepID=UPI002C8FEB4A|nr:hypothetical protein [Chitinophaga sp.]HVI43340.1 hypothetical protein [Chitinophaga sp.]